MEVVASTLACMLSGKPRIDVLILLVEEKRIP